MQATEILDLFVTAAKLIRVSIKQDYILRTLRVIRKNRITRHGFRFPGVYQHNERQEALQRVAKCKDALCTDYEPPEFRGREMGARALVGTTFMNG